MALHHGVAGIVKDAASTADSHGGGSVLAAGAVTRGGVHTAHGVVHVTSQHTNVPGLTPEGRPAHNQTQYKAEG
jgi:hypothetical protein